MSEYDAKRFIAENTRDRRKDSASDDYEYCENCSGIGEQFPMVKCRTCGGTGIKP